jgi:1-acyl-sn-glycerol-3-phosphate acyltransferase
LAEHIRINDAPPGPVSRAVRNFFVWLYRRHGWRAEGEVPSPRKFVIIAAPHTSNWDFVYYLGLVGEMGLDTRFMAKKSLFRWPIGGFMRSMGGVEINRAKGGNYVQAMVDQFNARDEFMLTVAPEGTRGKTAKWKTGFYQIALAAKVPLVVGLMDYGRKVGGLGPLIWPTGDFRADMEKVLAVYKSCTPKFPDLAVTSIDQIVGADEATA